MIAYLVRRILAVIPVMGIVVVIVFVLIRISPGDPAAIIAGDYATPEAVQKIRVAMGLDKPIYTQFWIYLNDLAHGRLGTSLHSGLPVIRLIGQRAEVTAVLAFLTLLFSVLMAVPLGILAGWKRGTWIDQSAMVFAVVGFSMPTFWLGFLLIKAFSINLHWLPVQGYRSPTEGLWPFIAHLILPVFGLAVGYMALLARITRATVIDVLNSDYIRTAYAKGATHRTVLFIHALKNAAVPVVTTVGVGLALLLSGAVITESVFALPGLGRLTVDAVLQRDYTIIQGVTLIFSFVYVVINLLIDLSYTFFDPRIRY